MASAVHGCHRHLLDTVRRLTACLAVVVFAVGVASASLASGSAHDRRQLAMSQGPFMHHPHVVELDLPATSTTIVPPAAAPAAAQAVAPSSAPASAPADTRVMAAAAPSTAAASPPAQR